MKKLTRWQQLKEASPQLAYFKPKPSGLGNKWQILRKLGKATVSEKAQLKLEWMIFYYTVGKENATDTATHFGISRKTFHKWLKRFDEKKLSTLEETSRAPEKTREWMVTYEQEQRIKTLRKQNMEYGKKKLKVLYEKAYEEKISTWKIERVIRQYKLYPDKVKQAKQIEKRRKSKQKVRIHEVKDVLKQITEFGFLWHIDAIVLWWNGQRRIIFTALEDKTKIAYARCYKSNLSGYAEDFLKRLMYLVEGKIEIMHQDNGSEFQGEFEKACQKLQILQIYSRPYTPKDNPALERFNNTIQTEWLDFSEVGLDDLLLANRDLTNWLIKYNSYRPHQSLDYLTPLEYAQQHFFQVLPMWSAKTHTLLF